LTYSLEWLPSFNPAFLAICRRGSDARPIML
jgi:hypothetical protein